MRIKTKTNGKTLIRSFSAYVTVSVCAVNAGRHRQATHTHTHAVPYFPANEINIFSISCAFDSLMQMHFVCSAEGGRTNFCRSPETQKTEDREEIKKNEGKINARLVHLMLFSIKPRAHCSHFAHISTYAFTVGPRAPAHICIMYIAASSLRRQWQRGKSTWVSLCVCVYASKAYWPRLLQLKLK